MLIRSEAVAIGHPDVKGKRCICRSDTVVALKLLPLSRVDLVAALRLARVMSRSLVECSRNVPMTMVTNPQISVVA